MQVRKASLEEIKRISSQWKIFRKYNREADDTEVIGQGRVQAKLFSSLPWTKLFMGRKPFETLSSIMLLSPDDSERLLPVSVPASTLESGVADMEERGAGEGTAGGVDTRSMSTSTSALLPFPVTGSTDGTGPLLGGSDLALRVLSVSGERLHSTWTHH